LLESLLDALELAAEELPAALELEALLELAAAELELAAVELLAAVPPHPASTPAVITTASSSTVILKSLECFIFFPPFHNQAGSFWSAGSLLTVQYIKSGGGSTR